MKSALIERYKNQNIHTNLAKIEMISNNIMNWNNILGFYTALSCSVNDLCEHV